MNKNECQNVIDKINHFLFNELWMDFELCVMNGYEVVLSGKLDERNDSFIEISFKQPCFVSSRMSFTYDGGLFMKILEGEESISMNKMYHVEQGNFIFQFFPFEDATPFFIIAEEIEVLINKNSGQIKNEGNFDPNMREAK